MSVQDALNALKTKIEGHLGAIETTDFAAEWKSLEESIAPNTAPPPEPEPPHSPTV